MSSRTLPSTRRPDPHGSGIAMATVLASHMSLAACALGAGRPGLAAGHSRRSALPCFVAIAFALLWLAVLCQVPLAAATALLGIAGTALVLGLQSTGRVFANDAMEFLTNWQVATLANVSDDGQLRGRRRHLKRYLPPGKRAACAGSKGGLAYATIFGCAGFGAVSGSSVATAATFGRIALPEMAKHKYDPGFGLWHRCGWRNPGGVGAPVRRDHSVCPSDRAIHRYPLYRRHGTGTAGASVVLRRRSS